MLWDFRCAEIIPAMRVSQADIFFANELDLVIIVVLIYFSLKTKGF